MRIMNRTAVPINVRRRFDAGQFSSRMPVAVAILPLALGLFFLLAEFQGGVFSCVYSYLK